MKENQIDSDRAKIEIKNETNNDECNEKLEEKIQKEENSPCEENKEEMNFDKANDQFESKIPIMQEISIDETDTFIKLILDPSTSFDKRKELLSS